MTRVLLASRVFAPESAAAAFRLRALVDALAEAGAEVEVLTAQAPPALRGSPPEREANRGARVRRWPVLRDASGYVRGYLPYLSFDVPLPLRLLVARRPDVAVVEPPPTTGAVLRTVLALRGLAGRRVPYVYYAADVWSDATAAMEEAPAPVVAILRGLERYALRGAAGVVAVSEGVAERVRDLIGDSRHTPGVCVIPNGVDTQTFAPEPAEGEHPGSVDLPPGPFLVYAGTASEWQGAEVFALAMTRVLEQVPDASLVYLGQGSSWPELQRLAGELPPGTVELRPLAPAREAATWQRSARAALVSVRPGAGYDFAYPTKVLAALACGTPVVYAGPGPAAADIREHHLGEAVEHSIEAVAAAMVRALRAEPSEGERQRRAQWVRRHRSLAAAGRRAARVVLGAAR